MANEIRIKRSVTTNTPASLAQGELAYSETGSPNGLGELFIGVAGPGVEKIASAGARPNQDVVAGTGMTGGGSTDTSTLNVIGGTGITANANDVALDLGGLGVATLTGSDWIAFDDAGVSAKALISGIDLGLFNNDAGWTANAGTVTSVAGGTGVTITGGGTVTPTVNLDYVGVDNFIDSATNLEGTAINVLDTVIYHDATDDTVKKGLVSDLPFGIGSGDISRVTVTAGLGLTGTVDTLTGDHAQTLDIDVQGLTGGTPVATDDFIFHNGTTALRVDIGSLDLALMNNSSGWQANDANTVLTTDTDASTLGWVIDEDNLGSNSATKVPTQQSVKAYVDGLVATPTNYKGAFDPTASAGAGSPNLNTFTSNIGDMYTVTVAGTYDFTTGTDPVLEVGDVLIAEADGILSDAGSWTIVQKNLEASSETVAGFIEIATQAETDTGTDDVRAITALKLANAPIDGGTF